MGEEIKSLYACCPKCGRSIGRAKRCDGIELTCSKCGSTLQIVVDRPARVSVELVKVKIPVQTTI